MWIAVQPGDSAGVRRRIFTAKELRVLLETRSGEDGSFVPLDANQATKARALSPPNPASFKEPRSARWSQGFTATERSKEDEPMSVELKSSESAPLRGIASQQVSPKIHSSRRHSSLTLARNLPSSTERENCWRSSTLQRDYEMIVRRKGVILRKLGSEKMQGQVVRDSSLAVRPDRGRFAARVSKILNLAYKLSSRIGRT